MAQITVHGNASNTIVVNAPTGSGKTLWASAIGSNFTPSLTFPPPSPYEYGYTNDPEHDKWRKFQYEALCELTKDVDKKYLQRCITISETKALQEQNYGNIYDFIYLFGKGNYACPLSGNRADNCKHKRNPRKCSEYGRCPYYARKRAAMSTNKCALNYAYFLTAKWPRQLAPSGFLVLDECHLLSDIVINHASVTVTEKQRRKHNLPEFPNLTTRGSSMFFTSTAEEAASEWLAQTTKIIEQKVMILELKAARDKSLVGERDSVANLLRSLQTTYQALVSNPQDWFIRSGSRALQVENNHTAPGFTAKPLTARHHFPYQFLHGGPTILMSATIGNFDTLVTELGIEEYKGIVVPNQWEPEARPVYVFDGAPKMGRSATESSYQAQAEIIAGMIGEVPYTWSGVIHCKAKKHARQLAFRLAQLGLSDRVWVPPYTGTDHQLQRWQQAKRHSKGKLAVTWSWWTGMDLGDERINIAAKVPYPYLGTDYSLEKMHYDGKFYLQRTAWQLQQGCGRTRRGEAKDYDHDGQRAGLVAVIDGNWNRVQKYFDDDFRNSITRWN